MPTNYIKRKKEDKKIHDKKVNDFKNELAKHKTKQKFDNVRVVSEDKAKAINYYNSLSESEKIVFQKELRKKEKELILH